ncbi:MAG: hypothetical protein DCC67_19945 [Planctomycetota bacterium]|nr:MAG: hypothetical protein DCC67_19945 [Planctomycetota bacterium]
MTACFGSIRGVASVLAALFALAGCQRQAAPPYASTASAPGERPEVVVAAASYEAWPRAVTVQGSLLADEDSIIGAKIAGRVESVVVDLGAVVRRGDKLVVLDRSDLNLQMELAEAQLAQAASAIGLTPADDETQVQFANSPRVELEQALVDEAQAAVKRAEQLLPTRAVTQAEFDALVAQLKAAQARYDSAVNAVREQIALIGVRRKELALARQRLADAETVAPFDGVIDARHVAPGEYVQVGQPLITLVRADRLRFTAGVPESKAGSVAAGQRVLIRTGGRKEPIDATVSRVSPTVTQTSRAVRIEADVPNEGLDLQAGQFAEAEIVVDPAAQALCVPASAITRFAGVVKVWLVANGQARQRTVRVGRQDQDRAEILAGLATGDQVVIDAQQGRDGPVIAIHPPQAGSAADAPRSAASAAGGL